MSDDLYGPVLTVPDGIRWKPAKPASKTHVVLVSMFGGRYKLARDRSTGEVAYYELKGQDAPRTPKETIDAEPEKRKQIRYRVGAGCWFVVDGRWFLCKVIERGQGNCVIASETGWDDERVTQWPYGETLQFSVNRDNDGNLFQRLRPLQARQR